MNQQAVRFRLGIFVLSALILLAVLIMLFGGWGRLFQHYNEYTIIFDNAAGVAAGTPVVCYPRPCDGAAFYLGLDHLTSFAEEHRDILVQQLASRPVTILFARSGQNLEELLRALPPGMTFTELDRRGGTTIGRIEH